jgi:hypothetical protein
VRFKSVILSVAKQKRKKMDKLQILWWLLGGGLVIYGIEKLRNSKTVSMTSSGTINNNPIGDDNIAHNDTLSKLDSKYKAANVNSAETLLQALYDANDPKTNKSLTNLQQRLMLSQALQETGLFTSKPNYHLINDFNNYAGVRPGSKTKQYKVAGSGFAKYPSIADFVNDWLRVLSFDFGAGRPLDATTVTDFVNRLHVNQYFGQSDLPNYQKNVPFYFDLLTGYIS